MIIRVSGFLGFFLVPRAPLNYDANTVRNETVGSRYAIGRKKAGKPGNPDDHEIGRP